MFSILLLVGNSAKIKQTYTMAHSPCNWDFQMAFGFLKIYCLSLDPYTLKVAYHNKPRKLGTVEQRKD